MKIIDHVSSNPIVFLLLLFTDFLIFMILFGPTTRRAIYLETTVFACRAFIYVFSMTELVFSNMKALWNDYKNKNYDRFLHVPIPRSFYDWQQVTSWLLSIMLILMCANEPILHCFSDMNGFEGGGLFTEVCEAGANMKFRYSCFSTAAIFLYYVLLIDLSVFSTWISAFVLVCGYVVSEVGLFILALAFFVLMFSSGVSTLDHEIDNFKGLHKSSLSFTRVTAIMYNKVDYADLHTEPVLFIAVVCFVITTVIFLLNLLVAQLNSAYEAIYVDMVGFARLNRSEIICDTMSLVSQKRWNNYVSALHLEERLEFNEGDVGLAGGVQILESASANPTTKDMIRRFGGSTSVKMQWPEDDQQGDENDRFDKMEKLIQKAMKRLTSAGKSKGAKSGAKGAQSGSGASSHSQSDTGA